MTLVSSPKMKSDEIRRRHGDLLQKLKSLKLATRDRKMQLKEMITMGKRNRPRTGFLKTPNHIVILKGMLAADIACIRQVFNQKCQVKVYTAIEMQKCELLIADLEDQLTEIDLDLEKCVEEFKRKQEEESQYVKDCNEERADSSLRIPSICPSENSKSDLKESQNEDTSLPPCSGRSANISSATRTSSVYKREKQALPPLAFNTRPPPKQDDMSHHCKPSSGSIASQPFPRYCKSSLDSTDSFIPQQTNITQTQRKTAMPMVQNRQKSTLNQRIGIQRQRTEFPTSKGSSRFRGQYMLKPSVGYPFGSSFPELQPAPRKKWNGKRFVTIPGEPSPNINKARQVVNIRQNTWLW